MTHPEALAEDQAAEAAALLEEVRGHIHTPGGVDAVSAILLGIAAVRGILACAGELGKIASALERKDHDHDAQREDRARPV